jgi:hypothetical protein
MLSWQSPKSLPSYGVSSLFVCCAYHRCCLPTAQAPSLGLGRLWGWWLYWRWWIGRSEVTGSTILLIRTRIKASSPYIKGGGIARRSVSPLKVAQSQPSLSKLLEAPNSFHRKGHYCHRAMAEENARFHNRSIHEPRPPSDGEGDVFDGAWKNDEECWI